MLNHIRLTGDQMKLLERAAERADSELAPEYPGEYAMLGGTEYCLGLDAGGAEDLAVFLAVVGTHDQALGGVLRARRASELTDPAEAQTYYWPGVLA